MSNFTIHSSIFTMSSAAARTIIHFRRGSGISTTGPRVVPTTTDELAALLLLAVELDRWRSRLADVLPYRIVLRPWASPSSILSIWTISDGSPT